MRRKVSDLLREQHGELRQALDGCFNSGSVDAHQFDVFRHRLLWHVSVEERVVMPAIVTALKRSPGWRSGLKKDHAGIAALCVPRPEREWLENLKDLLDAHYRVEETDGGLLSTCDEVLKGPLELHVVTAIEGHPPLTLAPFRRGASVRSQVTALLRMLGVTERVSG